MRSRCHLWIWASCELMLSRALTLRSMFFFKSFSMFMVSVRWWLRSLILLSILILLSMLFGMVLSNNVLRSIFIYLLCCCYLFSVLMMRDVCVLFWHWGEDEHNYCLYSLFQYWYNSNVWAPEQNFDFNWVCGYIKVRNCGLEYA